MARGGLAPRGLYHVVDGQKSGAPPALPEALTLPNASGMLGPELRFLVEKYGLGRRCLLVSEGVRAARALHVHHPNTEFLTTDFFIELMTAAHEGEDACSFLWDLRDDTPAALTDEGPFSSIVAQALLEHVIDPVSVLARLASLLGRDAVLFGMTHTPSFHYHPYPRDYVRFHHDFFEDLPEYLLRRHDLRLSLIELISRDGCVWFAYRRTD